MKTIQRTLSRATTVADLIAELKGMDQNAVVCFACDYGDYCHTEQLLPVRQVSELERHESVAESGYSQSGLAIATSNEEDEEDEGEEIPEEEKPSVVILR